MASAIFTLKDTPEARTELALLLQIGSQELDKLSRNGLLTVEFPNLLEDKVMHVLSRAVANHGFLVQIDHKVEAAVAKAKTVVSSAVKAIEGKPDPKGDKK